MMQHSADPLAPRWSIRDMFAVLVWCAGWCAGLRVVSLFQQPMYFIFALLSFVTATGLLELLRRRSKPVARIFLAATMLLYVGVGLLIYSLGEPLNGDWLGLCSAVATAGVVGLAVALFRLAGLLQETELLRESPSSDAPR